MATALRESYDITDGAVQDKLGEKFGKMATYEAFVVAFLLFAAHKAVQTSRNVKEIEELDSLWCGSIAPKHPLHPGVGTGKAGGRLSKISTTLLAGICNTIRLARSTNIPLRASFCRKRQRDTSTISRTLLLIA
jgi:hypothetical protein